MPTIDCLVEKQIFPSVNRCIYCGETGNSLSDEHIIPYGLYGEMVLQKSSCKKCSKITSQFEQTVLRTMFGATRIHLGLRTRRPKERPKQLTTFVGSLENFERKDVSIRDHPHAMTMVMIPPPKILGRTGGVKEGGIKVWVRDIQGNTNERASHIGENVHIRNIIPLYDFCRLMAKIAHSYTVALLGIDSFQPTLVDFILGRKQNVFDFVGGPDETTDFPKDESLLHQIALSGRSNPSRPDLPSIIIADICLFSCFGAPSYQAVVGKQISKTK